MSEILNSLTAGNPAAPSGPTGAPGPEGNPGAVANDLHPLLAGLATGKIPGVNIPHGFESPDASALMPIALKLGLKLFKPLVDKDVLFSVVNPKTVNVAELKKADQAGDLDKIFPPITEFFPHQAAPESAAPQPTEPSATPVPVLPRASKPSASITRERVRSTNPGTPSSRPVPGGGVILNSLMQRPI